MNHPSPWIRSQEGLIAPPDFCPPPFSEIQIQVRCWNSRYLRHKPHQARYEDRQNRPLRPSFPVHEPLIQFPLYFHGAYLYFSLSAMRKVNNAKILRYAQSILCCITMRKVDSLASFGTSYCIPFLLSSLKTA